ncbi:hypothetical protein AC579_4447 [Pseudocercospora musae]|uniref:RanBD1 domain-containing protein n=1 Tax=Pseudocercospora musae TaxID=113226 RepID=A0A139H8S4_9PEZI|nr:hypothetical protein AC579_4447 [Pseudocercospora musae]
MSKRGAGSNWASGEDRYGGAAPGMENTDKPLQATAAQMAKRNSAPPSHVHPARSTTHRHHARIPNRHTIVLFHTATAVMATHIPPEYTLARTRYLTFTSKHKELDKKLIKEYEQLIGLLPEEFLKYGTGRTDVKARIAAAKKTVRTPIRGNSPAVNIPPQPNPFGGGGGGGMFGAGAMQQPQQQQQPAANPFTASSFDFNFGGNQTNGTSTNNPFAFGASAPAPSQPQQNGGQNMFGQSAAPSFGTGTATSFGTNASQPQQNGFNPSTPMFNQPSQSQQASTGFSFGATASTQQNGTSTPTTSFGGFGAQAPQTNSNGNVSFNFGGAAQEKQEPKPSTPFAGFGQTSAASNNQTSNLFGNLGQNSSQNGDKPSTPFAGFGTQSTQQNGTLFSGNGQEKPKENGQTTSNLFGNIGQQKTPEPEQSNTLFSGIVHKPAESSGTSTNLFGNLGQKPLSSAGNNLFAAASQPEQQTPKPTTSLFSGLSNTQPPKPSTSLFNAPSVSVPASTGKGLFGSQVMSNEPSKGTGSVLDNLPPRETPQFGSHIPGQAYKEGHDEEEQQAESGKTELFPKSKATDNVPPSVPFGGFESTQPASSTSLFKTSSDQQDTSMTTPSATPQKSLFAPSVTTATQPPARSLFDRIDAPAPSATPAAQAAKSLFDRIEQKQDGQASLFNNASATSATTKPMFSQPAPASEAPSASLFQKPASSAHLQVPSKNIFSQTPAASSTAAVPTAAQSSTTKQPLPPAKHTFKEPGYAGYRPVAAAQGALSESQRASFEKLNDALLVHINKLETNQDLSEIFRFALVASAEIAGRSRPSESELNPAARAAVPAQAATGSASFSSAAPANATTSFGKQSVQGSGSNTAAPPQTNLFAQTPKAAPATSLFSQPPATAPTKKRSFEEDSDDLAQQPATEKRSKPNEPPQHPKLPAAASNTAKLFASTLEKRHEEETPKSALTSGFNPSTKSLFSAPSSGSAALKPATAGFAPSLDAQTKPATPLGFTPAGGAAAGGSFLSSFGAAAKAQEEKDRKKRKAEDYDSDEETEEQWLKRDKEEQDAKRKKIEEAAKSAKCFSFTSSNGPTSPAKQSTAAALEKAQGKGDNTWKPETPIKFSLFNAGDNASTTPAVSPPKLGGGSLFANSAAGKTIGGGLFSAGSASANTSSKLAPPSTGFNFSSQPSSLGVSRATTPGVTTDGEASTAAEGEDGDAETSNDPQAEDQTGLTIEERNANDILGEFHDVKTSKFEVNDQGQKKWVPKGFGVVYLLKDKETGKTRILSRVGTGKLTLNYNPLKGSKYATHPKKDTMVTAAFWDHLHTTEPALGQFIMTTSQANDASELARILTEGTPQ